MVTFTCQAHLQAGGLPIRPVALHISPVPAEKFASDAAGISWNTPLAPCEQAGPVPDSEFFRPAACGIQCKCPGGVRNLPPTLPRARTGPLRVTPFSHAVCSVFKSVSQIIVRQVGPIY